MSDAASPPPARAPGVRLRALLRAASQAGLVAALLAVFTVCATTAGTCALLLTAGNESALSAAVADADGSEGSGSPDIATVLGGGWIASGSAVASRQPLPVWPTGLKTLAREGAGVTLLVDRRVTDVAVEIAIRALRQAERPVDVDAER